MERREQVPQAPAREGLALARWLAEPLSSEHAALLTQHIRGRRWFRGKARKIEDIKVVDHVSLADDANELVIAIVRVRYLADPPELYVVPLGLAHAEAAAPASPLVELPEGWVYDPTGGQLLSERLLHLQLRAETPGRRGVIVAQPEAALIAKVAGDPSRLPARVPSGEQSNTSVFYGQELMLKLFRVLESGSNPDVEINQFLWQHGYRHVPEPLGSLRYQRDGLDAVLGITQRFIASEGTAWELTLAQVERAYELALERSLPLDTMVPSRDLLESSQQQPPAELHALLGPYAEQAALLGKRTAQLHVVLASDADNAAFQPEPMSAQYLQTQVKITRERITRNYDLLSHQLANMPASTRVLANDVLAARDQLLGLLDGVASARVDASLIRCHGDYHLGQVLYTGTDFVLLDFEGEPAQTIEVRRQKRSALYDVCGMLRSFHYAATFALLGPRWRPEERQALRPAAEVWHRWVSALFLGAYLQEASSGGRRPVFLPQTTEQLRTLLPLHLIDKCAYELGYELNNRPDWVGVPLAALLSLANPN
ncbi:MAG: putative maltokinase [Polyangiales bacterium]